MYFLVLEEGAFNGQIVEGAAVNECLHSHRSLLVLLFPLCPLYRCCTLRSLVLPPPICIDVFLFETFLKSPLIIGPYTWKQKNTPGYSPLPPPLTQKTPLITMLMYCRVTLYKYIIGTPAGIPLWVHRGTRTTSPLLGDDPVEIYSQHDYLPNIKVK